MRPTTVERRGTLRMAPAMRFSFLSAQWSYMPVDAIDQSRGTQAVTFEQPAESFGRRNRRVLVTLPQA